MKTKIIFFLLLIVNTAFTSSAFEKANDDYVKYANSIVLVPHAFKSWDENICDDEILINIKGFRTNEWFITIVDGDETILSGSFSMECYKIDNHLFFKGYGINKVTDEVVKFRMNSYNNSTYLSFESPKLENIIHLKYDRFKIDKNYPHAMILFSNCIICSDISEDEWKRGTLKQLKKCLTQNPLIKKI